MVYVHVTTPPVDITAQSSTANGVVYCTVKEDENYTLVMSRYSTIKIENPQGEMEKCQH